MDIVTGRELLSVYFDPSKVVECVSRGDKEWVGEHLYAPASVIKEDIGGCLPSS